MDSLGDLECLTPGVRPGGADDERLILRDRSSPKIYGYDPRSETFFVLFWPAEDIWLKIKAKFSDALWLLSMATDANIDPHSRLAWVDYVMSQLPVESQISAKGA